MCEYHTNKKWSFLDLLFEIDQKIPSEFHIFTTFHKIFDSFVIFLGKGTLLSEFFILLNSELYKVFQSTYPDTGNSCSIMHIISPVMENVRLDGTTESQKITLTNHFEKIQ